MIEWRTVREAPEYQVSGDGRIKSVYTNRPLAGGIDKDGYRKLVLCTGSRRIHRRVAALVCEAFHGPRPEGMGVRHLDGSRDNDAADNLAWSTHAANCADKLRHGTAQRGEKHPQSKLTAAEVREIRDSSEPGRVLGERYGVSTHTIRAVRARQRWKHVP